MGYRNAAQAVQMWPHLAHRDARCLLVMALAARDRTSPDGQAARVYWGGHDVLAWSLGLADWDQEPSATARREVRRIIARLIAAGAVKPVNHPQGGARAEYLLALGP